MFPNLNPTAYIALGSIIFNIWLLGYSFTVKTQLRASEGQFRAFVAEVDMEKAIREREILREGVKRDKITAELTKENEKLQGDLAVKHAEYRRLLNSKDSAARMPTLPDATEGIAKPEYEARLARALGQLEAGVLSELAESRDQAISQANFCASWVNKQSGVE